MVASLEEPEKFACIFDRHSVAIHGFLARRLGRQDADGLLGEVFRIAFERRDRYHVMGTSCLPWLYGIAGNLVHEHRRGMTRRNATMRRLEAQVRPLADLVDEANDRLDAQTAWPLVRAALERLSPGERELVLLVAWEDLSYEQAAEALAIPIGTVRSRLSRARSKLSDFFDMNVVRRTGNPSPEVSQQ